MAERTLSPIRTCNGCGKATTDYTEHDVFGTTHIVCSGCEASPDPVPAEQPTLADRRKSGLEAIESARAALLVAAKELDGSGAFFAWHSVLLAMSNVDDAKESIRKLEASERQRARYEDELERAS